MHTNNHFLRTFLRRHLQTQVSDNIYSVVLLPDGDEGYEEYIEQCEGDDSSVDDGSEDEGHGI